MRAREELPSPAPASPRLVALLPLACGAALALAGACGGSGGGRTFQHASVFVVTGSHKGLGCDDCHDRTKPSFALVNGGVDCLHCHDQGTVQPLHSGVGGFAYDTGACIGCHKDGSGGLPANHDAQLFPVTSTVHAAVGCAQCHGATKKAADLQCATCHDHDQATMASKHASIPATAGGVANYQWVSTSCVRCHADGQVNRIASHAGGESGINNRHGPWCLTCHPGTRADKPWGADFTSRGCTTCHPNGTGG